MSRLDFSCTPENGTAALSVPAAETFTLAEVAKALTLRAAVVRELATHGHLAGTRTAGSARNGLDWQFTRAALLSVAPTLPRDPAAVARKLDQIAAARRAAQVKAEAPPGSFRARYGRDPDPDLLSPAERDRLAELVGWRA